MIQNEGDKAALFLHTAIRDICSIEQPSQTTLMDFGCGAGELMTSLLALGYDAYGCDITAYWLGNPAVPAERVATISRAPYRLPFASNTFDVVVSTSVLEHAQNKEEIFREIYRVLRAGGYSMHLFPGKWYLPFEPHTYVPLVNFFWPKCPRWWLGFWALVGVRNEFQRDKSWKEVLAANHRYCLHGLSYWSNGQYRQLSLEVFGNHFEPREFHINNGYGGFAKVFRRLPFKRVSGWLSGECRMNFIVQRKSPTGS